MLVMTAHVNQIRYVLVPGMLQKKRLICRRRPIFARNMATQYITCAVVVSYRTAVRRSQRSCVENMLVRESRKV
jgi:hypothetical protein